MVKKLTSLLSRRDKQFLFFLLLFSIVISLIETAGVGVIMPFISIASDFENIHKNVYLEKLYIWIGTDELHFVVIFGIALILFYVLRAILNFFYFYLLARFSQGRYHLIAYRLFENYMGYNYKDFLDKNSSFIVKTIVNEANNLVQLISQTLFLLSEVFVVLFIYGFLLSINWKMTLLLTLFLAINIFILKITVSKRIKRLGELREKAQARFYEIMNLALGNFKIIKLRGNEKQILKSFQDASSQYALANIKNQSLAQVPRLFLEAIGFSLIAFIVIYLILKYQTDIKAALPILMAFVLGLYRLMPSVNRIITAYNQILFYKKSLDIVHNELIYEVEEIGSKEVEFNKEIRLERVSFEYREGKPVLKDIDLVIRKGESVGIIGESGSGKSTLVDIIIGLYRPKSGRVYVDEQEIDEENVKSWRKKIGYIPQHIYLFDGTVAQNVAFGEEIDEKRVKEALKKANILDFLEMHHNGIETQVGENGLKLSGGQKQRIAIARALYNNPEVLVLDEATSALDSETEEKIMKEIYRVGKGKTLIIIAHRLSTLSNCDRIIHIKDGKIEKGKK